MRAVRRGGASVRLPVFVQLVLISALAMLLPAVAAAVEGAWSVAGAFAGSAALIATLALLVAIAARGAAHPLGGREPIVALVGAFALLPLIYAVPFHQALPRVGFLNAWFEMISSFTTTGATLFDSPAQLSRPLHLWRATVGWLGGLMTWIAAVGIFAPLGLGGFEVRAAVQNLSRGPGAGADPSTRLTRQTLRLTPIYAGATALLAVVLLAAGEAPVVAIAHAMSVLSTSGISPVGGLERAESGFVGELAILLFLTLALTRATFGGDLPGEDRRHLLQDGELRLALVLIAGVTAILTARHFVAGAEGEGLFAAVWGAWFTATSFLTTTGFESLWWLGATDYAGLSTPGLALVGLCLIGGGVATTAGGVKLLRAGALIRHGGREVGKLISPNSLGGHGAQARRVRRQGAAIAWVFVMLFALSIAATMVALSATGLPFEASMVLAVSALSTTGPLATVAAETPVSWAGIPAAAKGILAFAMVVGRLETLALVAMLSAEFWRR
ncbi:MAG: TrkH family potassium uptake protein [Paracoccaceae bacterium]